MTNTTGRYKDVLIALAVAHKYGESLGRLQLQKFIYLGDILSLLWEMFSPTNGYETYKRGPYDRKVQNAVDVLAFRGAVSIATNKNYVGSNGVVSYSITPIGMKIVTRMESETPFLKALQMYNVIGVHINQRGWQNLRKIVYSEATYISNKGAGYGVPLKTNSLLSNLSAQIIWGFEQMVRNKETSLSKENLVSIFFRVLDNSQQLTSN